MNDSKNLKVRRVPVQSRAKMTLDSILDATEELIKERGYQQVNTSCIAERVGVSVSSLYQYFSNKEAIFTALYESIALRTANELRTRMYGDILLDDDVYQAQDSATSTLGIFFDVMDENKEVLIMLEREMPALRDTVASLALEKLIYNTTREFLKHAIIGSEKADVEVVQYILYTLIFESVKKYLLEEPKPFPKEVFLKELHECMLACFKKEKLLAEE